MTQPLSREDRAAIVARCTTRATDADLIILRYEATLQQVEGQFDAVVELIGSLQETLDGQLQRLAEAQEEGG